MPNMSGRPMRWPCSCSAASRCRACATIAARSACLPSRKGGARDAQAPPHDRRARRAGDARPCDRLHPLCAHRRRGALVEDGSVARADDGKTVTFKVTDGSRDVGVTYVGVLPDLFREGQGVVIEGALGADGSVRAASVLAKHDENYMPREVVDALKKSGHWQETGPPPGTAARR